MTFTMPLEGVDDLCNDMNFFDDLIDFKTEAWTHTDVSIDSIPDSYFAEAVSLIHSCKCNYLLIKNSHLP